MHCFPNSLITELFSFRDYFMGLMFCKNLSKCCLWWQQHLHISCIFPIFCSSVSFSLSVFSQPLFVCPPLLSLSRPYCLVPSFPPLSCSLSSPIFFMVSLAFQEAAEFSLARWPRGRSCLIVQHHSWKVKLAVALPAHPRGGVHVKVMGFHTTSASLRRDPLF